MFIFLIKIYTYGDIKPVTKQNKKEKKASSGDTESRKKVSRVESSGNKRDNSDVENSGIARRKSSRLSGKVTLMWCITCKQTFFFS